MQMSAVSVGTTAKPHHPPPKKTEEQLIEEHSKHLDKVLRNKDRDWSPASASIAKYIDAFSTLPDIVKFTVLAKCRQIVPAIEDGVMRSPAVAVYKTLLMSMAVEDQTTIIHCLWNDNQTAQTSQLQRSLTQLLPLGVHDAMFAELGAPLLDELPKKKAAESTTAKSETGKASTVYGTARVEKFEFYQSGEIDQTLVKSSGTNLDEMLSTGNASGIRQYLKKGFQSLVPAEKRIVLAECPGLVDAIKAGDTDALKAYQQLLKTLSPADQESVIRRVWQNCPDKNLELYQALADLLPLEQLNNMLADLGQIEELQKKTSADPAAQTDTASFVPVVTGAAVGIQLRQALVARNTVAIKALEKDFEKLGEDEQMRVLKDCSKQLNDLLGSRKGYFSSDLSIEAADMLDAYHNLLWLIQNPSSQVEVVVDLISAYGADSRPGVHLNYARKRMDLVTLLPAPVRFLAMKLLSPQAQDGYSGIMAKPVMRVSLWITAFVAAVKNGDTDAIRCSEKLFELIPRRKRYEFLIETFLKRDHAMRSGTRDAAVQIRAFARLFKSVAINDRERIGMHFTGGVLNALKRQNIDALRAFGELIDLIPKDRRGSLSFWLLEGDKPGLLRFFPSAALETQHALLRIAQRMFNADTHYKTVNLYLDLISSIKDPDSRSALIQPKDKTLKQLMDEATLSLHYKTRLYFTDRLQALLSSKSA